MPLRRDVTTPDSVSREARSEQVRGRHDGLLTAAASIPTTTRHSVPAGTTLFRQFGLPDSVHVIEHGVVKLVRWESSGQHAVVGLRDRGSLLGAAAATLGAPSPADAETLTPCAFLTVPAVALRHQMLTDLQFALLINQTLSDELYTQMELLGAVSTLSAKERLLRLLNDLTHDAIADSVTPRWVRIGLPFRYRDLADTIQCSPERLSRVLTELEREGVLRRHNGWLLVRSDPPASSKPRTSGER